jgi:tetratricopeptide (TPR) repeat protein
MDADKVLFRTKSGRANSATIEASNARTLKAPKMQRRLFVAVLLCLAVDLGAGQPAPNFQSQEFRSALAAVLHARFDDFAALKTGATLFQLPKMSCSLSSHGKIASYLCSAPASSKPDAERLYGDIASTVEASLPGYPLCYKPSVANNIEVTSFCHYPKIVIPDVSVQAGKGVVLLEVFGREAGDRGQPVEFLHAYALAELGRHADAIKALEPILGPEIDRHLYDQERFAYDAAVKGTQNCTAEQTCVASDFLAVGNTREALRSQNRIFKSIEEEKEANRQRGEILDVASAKSVTLADAYDLNARIEAAIGKVGPALRDLDSAFEALPEDAKAAPREAIYFYHRALILAESQKYADAAKACREWRDIQGSNNKRGELSQQQCLEIEVLASGHAAAGASEGPINAESAADLSVQGASVQGTSIPDPLIRAQIEEVAGTDNYSALPRPTEAHRPPDGASNSPEWAVENGTGFTLHVLMSGPSDERIDLAAGGSGSVALPPGKYNVAAVVDRSNTLLFYGEQTVRLGMKYTSHFVVPAN